MTDHTVTHPTAGQTLSPHVQVPAPRRVLVADDEEAIRNAIARFLRSRGFDVETADSGGAALEALRRSRFAALVSDVRMPGMTGLQLVPQALAIDPDLAILMLTGAGDAPTATQALSNGAFDYLMKPIRPPELEQALERALAKRTLLMQQREVERMIREEVAARTAEVEREKEALRRLTESLRALTVSVAETLINAMEAKDVYLRGHSQRVADLAAAIAEELALDADSVEHVRLAGRLHDVGKIGIREAVLNKPGMLTTEEFDHIQDHVKIGMDILAPLRHLGVVLTYVHDHHEHWDGSGYPRGLRGEEISIGGRILTAADAFDALTSKRAYRDPLTPEGTLALLGKEVDALLEPRVYAALCRVVSRRQTLEFIEPSGG